MAGKAAGNEVVAADGAAGQALANLAQYADEARGAFARNTERAIRADTAVFTDWCSRHGHAALPASPRTLAAFVDAMQGQVQDGGPSEGSGGHKRHRGPRKPATIRRYVSSVAHLHRAAGLPNPADGNAVRLALRRMTMKGNAAQAQAGALTRRLADRLLDAGGSRLRDFRNRALLAVAYDTLCRRSELVALLREDLHQGPHGDGTVKVRRSKTDQEGEGMVRYLAPDTMQFLLQWVEAAGIADGRLFRGVLKSGRVGGVLDAGTVARVFKELARAAGLPKEEVARISAHSSRVGAAQDMAASDRISTVAIMQAGGWKTPRMVARYTQRQEARRGGAARLAEMQHRT